MVMYYTHCNTKEIHNGDVSLSATLPFSIRSYFIRSHQPSCLLPFNIRIVRKYT